MSSLSFPSGLVGTHPNLLLSDNAKIFKSSVLKLFPQKNIIEKQFILPASPWWGGFYERLICSIKLPLKKKTGRHTNRWKPC